MLNEIKAVQIFLLLFKQHYLEKQIHNICNKNLNIQNYDKTNIDTVERADTSKILGLLETVGMKSGSNTGK